MFAPEIGTNVHYRQWADGEHKPPQGAIIAAHNENGTVNLCVIEPNGATSPLTEIVFGSASEGASYCEEIKPHRHAHNGHARKRAVAVKPRRKQHA